MANKRFESKLFQTFFSKCLCKGRTATKHMCRFKKNMAQDLNNVIPDSGGLQSVFPPHSFPAAQRALLCTSYGYRWSIGRNGFKRWSKNCSWMKLKEGPKDSAKQVRRKSKMEYLENHPSGWRKWLITMVINSIILSKWNWLLWLIQYLLLQARLGFALPAAVQKCRMPPQVTPAKKGKCTKMFSGIYDTNGFAWSRVLTHLKTGMFRVLLADLPFKKFLLEDPTTLLNFINLLVRTLSKCFAHSFLFMLLHRFFSNSRQIPKNTWQLHLPTLCVTPSPLKTPFPLPWLPWQRSLWPNSMGHWTICEEWQLSVKLM